MKAIIKHNNNVKLENINIPQIDEVNNILIKVKLAAICRTDLNVAEGIISSKEDLTLGHEFYGEIVQIGDSVKHFSAGDIVSINPTIFGENKDLMCGVDVDGAFAEYIKVPEYLVYKLPSEIKGEYGAFTEPVAASLAVINAGFNINANVCIYGKNRIADLTFRILKAYGYERVSIHSQKDELAGSSYDVIIETIAASPDMTKIVNGVKKGGMIVLKSRQYKPVEITVNTLVKKEIKMIAVNYGDFNEAIKLLASGKLDLDDLIGKTYKLEDFEEAFKASKDSESKKIFLEI